MNTTVVKTTPFSMSQAEDRLFQLAQERFPPDRFEHIPGVVVFAEHRTQLRDGRPAEYSPEVLERIAANCNRRIERTGNWAAVCLGHTDPRQGPKPAIGFAGPFWVDRAADRSVIKADFWIFKDQVEELRRYPRPSPEVWIPTDSFDPDRIFLDPIAMLGADAPRLDLGMTFLYQAQDGQGFWCEKYAAVFPSAANVSMPQWKQEDSPKKKTSYQKGPEPMALSPEDIQAILKAIEATDWYKWIRQQMAASQKPEQPAQDQDQKPPEAPEGKKETYADKEDGENPEDKNQLPEEPEGKQDQDKKPKQVEEYRCKTTYSREAEMQMQKEIYQLRQEVERERSLRINTDRRRRLERLARYYALDVEEEMQLCQYGRMDDKAFSQHCERIEKYYRQIPAEVSLPVGGQADADWAGPASRELYQRRQQEELSQKAADLARRLANRGQYISYEEALERVQRGEA